MADRFAVIGDPIGHSLSPAMHMAAFAAAGLTATYERLHVTASELGSVIERLRSGYRGFNVTVPHKESVVPYMSHIVASAITMGAVNTVIVENESLSGHNTDAHGFQQTLVLEGVAVRKQRCVVLGAGGAARAAVDALIASGAHVTIVNRDVSKAARIAQNYRTSVEVEELGSASTPRVIAESVLVVNATSLGLRGLADPSPLPAGSRLGRDAIVFDMIYGRDTAFLKHARQIGCRTIDGMEMLVQQGAESFRLWTRVEPDVEVMRAACLDQIREVQ